MIKALIFDKDGTLFDFRATWSAWAGRALEDLAGGDAARLAHMADALGYDLETRDFLPTSSVIAGTVEEQAENLATLLPEMSVAQITERLNTLALTVVQVEVTPLGPFLASLKADGYLLGLATNDAESSARAHLASVGALDAFDFIAGYDSGFGGKPAPGQLLAFIDVTGLEPASIAMVGDSTHDLAAARAAGMVGAGVLTGPAGEAQLAGLADVVLPSIVELPAWLATSR
ncbi:MAG: HAD family hydrolase [Pseudomonadota bacterium]